MKPPDFFPDRSMRYSDWYKRERAASRNTRPGPGPHNVGITPPGYDHTPFRRPSPAWRRVYGNRLGRPR